MRHFLFILTLSMILSGCSSLTLRTDYDEKIDFSSFKTYRWHTENQHNIASLKYLDHILDQRIRAEINAELQQKGYIKVDSGPVDFWINYSVVVKEKADIRTYNNYNGMYPGYGYGRPYGYYGGGMAMSYSTGSNTEVTYYNQGTLLIDILNPATDQLMWRGAADGRLPKSSDRKKSDKLVKAYVSKILSDFPPED